MAKLRFQKSGVAIAFVAYHCSPPENIERKETWYETGEKLKCYLVFIVQKNYPIIVHVVLTSWMSYKRIICTFN